jgi:formiminotetrahydrofolate cyclodeaminase
MAKNKGENGAARALAVEAVRAGGSLRDVAAAVSNAIGETISHVTIRRWVKEAELRGDVEVEAHDSEPPPEEEQAEAIEGDTLAVTREMMARALRRATNAEKSGNYTAAQRAGRDAADLAKVVARLERLKGEDGDAVHISRGAVAELMSTVRARVEAILERPLLCAHCSRQLSIDWGTGGKKSGEVG